MRVLVAEDDDAVADFVLTALHDEGHDVVRVSSLRAAVGAPGSFDVALAAGLEQSWERLEEPDATHLGALAGRMPVVLCSGRGWVIGVEPGTMGLFAILPKPFDLEELLATLAAAAAGRGAD